MLGAPASAQYVPPAPGTAPAAPVVQPPSARGSANPLCTFHGPGCDAPPAAWEWQRLSPSTAAFSVELPCDADQAGRFGEIIAMSRANFPGKSTRACMKASSGFIATLVGFPAPASGPEQQVEIDAMLNGEPDLFSAFVAQTKASSATTMSFKGRRAIANTTGTREEADAAVERFIQSLEIAA